MIDGIVTSQYTIDDVPCVYENVTVSLYRGASSTTPLYSTVTDIDGYYIIPDTVDYTGEIIIRLTNSSGDLLFENTFDFPSLMNGDLRDFRNLNFRVFDAELNSNEVPCCIEQNGGSGVSICAFEGYKKVFLSVDSNLLSSAPLTDTLINYTFNTNFVNCGVTDSFNLYIPIPAGTTGIEKQTILLRAFSNYIVDYVPGSVINQSLDLTGDGNTDFIELLQPNSSIPDGCCDSKYTVEILESFSEKLVLSGRVVCCDSCIEPINEDNEVIRFLQYLSFELWSDFSSGDIFEVSVTNPCLDLYFEYVTDGTLTRSDAIADALNQFENYLFSNGFGYTIDNNGYNDVVISIFYEVPATCCVVPMVITIGTISISYEYKDVGVCCGVFVPLNPCPFETLFCLFYLIDYPCSNKVCVYNTQSSYYNRIEWDFGFNTKIQYGEKACWDYVFYGNYVIKQKVIRDVVDLLQGCCGTLQPVTLGAFTCELVSDQFHIKKFLPEVEFTVSPGRPCCEDRSPFCFDINTPVVFTPVVVRNDEDCCIPDTDPDCDVDQRYFEVLEPQFSTQTGNTDKIIVRTYVSP